MSSAAIASGLVLGSAAVAAWGAVYPGAQLFGPTLRTTGDSSSLALTFDDGPNPSVTPALLELLERHGARGTFFLTGKHVRAFPALTHEIAERGHVIGNHTDSHPSLIFLSAAELLQELRRCHDSIESAAAGYQTRWMRPPYGFRSLALDRVVRQMGYSGIVMWSRLTRDWRPQPPKGMIRRLRRAAGGDIILMHDADHRVSDADRHHVVQSLTHWLPRWKDAGLKFVTADGIDPSLAGLPEPSGSQND